MMIRNKKIKTIVVFLYMLTTKVISAWNNWYQKHIYLKCLEAWI